MNAFLLGAALSFVAIAVFLAISLWWENRHRDPDVEAWCARLDRELDRDELRHTPGGWRL